MNLTVTGIDEVNRMFRQVDKVGQKIVTASAKAGSNIALKQARKDAPVDKGNLKRGVKKKAEKRIRGKKVYDIKFVGDFVKISKNGNRSFYPISQEYGWITQKGNKFVPKHAGFLRNALKDNRIIIREKMTEVMAQGLREVIPR